MHVCNTSTLSLEKTALLNKLHKLEESNLEKVDKLLKLEEKYEILQETLKITERRLVEKEIECASLTEKIFIVNTQTESNDHPKTSMSTKEREIKPSKRKIKKPKSSGRNANKTSDSDENQAFAKEKNDLLRQIDFLNSIILDTKLKEPNKSLLTTFWIFFRCGQLIFRMADCEVEGTIASPISIPLERAMSPTGKGEKEGGNIRTRQNPLGPQERQTRISKAWTFSLKEKVSQGNRTLQCIFKLMTTCIPGIALQQFQVKKTRPSSYGVLPSPAELGYERTDVVFFLHFLMNGAVN
ncbi:hypothetical protein TNCV_3374351 [Trichonephila clavipes]|nr:hypothetical protein TNCV_3374351 [Trichonephila clavipes]